MVRTVASIGVVALCACAGGTTATSGRPNSDFGALNGATIELSASGGIAALATDWRASHDDRSYAFVRRHICGPTCPPPLDSASGVLSASAADSLFGVVWSVSPMQLRDDYGVTPGAADMFDYSLRITFDGTTKTVHADDGTMPSAMRRILDILRGTIDTARSRK